MAKNYFARYVWLIGVINRHGYIRKEDIDRLWARSSLNEKRDKELPERTFHNHRQAILDVFGIDIKCDRSLGYYIADDDADGGEVRQWLLESLSLNNVLNETRDMRDRILFEKVPSSQKWLSVVVNAMRDRKAVEITYQSFWRDEKSSFTAHPYCLKLFKQRWYMLAKSEDRNEPRTYALDERMIDMAESKTALKVPAKFNANEFFSNYFGVFTVSGRKPAEVVIKVEASQARYIETLKLHASQEVVESTPEYSVFRYRLVPTLDFMQEILSHGQYVEVLAPDDFREEIRDEIAAMAKHYGL